MGLANSVALKLSGISNLTKDPEGGTIVRTVDGGNIEFDSFVSRCFYLLKASGFIKLAC